MDALEFLYEQVSERLDRADFGALWRGFSRSRFALYDGREVLLGGRRFVWDERFTGNTAITFEGETVAIWKIEGGECDCDGLAADIAHELFHAFQQKSGETRWPRDLEALDYPQDARNFSLKLAENRVLARAFRTPDAAKKRGLLAEFCAIREARRGLIGGFLDYELATETVEGMAEYIGCRALAAINAEAYGRRAKGYLDALERPGAMLFDVRRLAYYSGAVFLLCLADAGADIYHPVGAQTLPVYELARGQLPEAASFPTDGQPDARVARECAEYFGARREKLRRFVAAATTRAEGEFGICGYDPMNMWKADGLMFCEHFIMLREGEGEPRFIEGPVALEPAQDDPFRIRAYVK